MFDAPLLRLSRTSDATLPAACRRRGSSLRDRVAGSVVLLAAFAQAGTSGCADSRSTRVRGPDGSADWWQVTCRDVQRHCYDEASRKCPMGYEVAENEGRHDVGIDTTLYSGQMLIKCKGPPG